MNAPSEDMVSHAFAYLMNNVHFLNGTTSVTVQSNPTRQQVDAQIAATQIAADALQSYANSQLVELRKYRNRLARIHGLPVELLSRVLFESLDPDAWTLNDLQNLALVSRSWCKVVFGTPEFWSRIDVNTSPRSLRVFLRNSGSVPLQIHCETTKDTMVSRLEDFVDLVSRQAGRWETLYFRGQATRRLLQQLGTSKPNLKTLRIEILWYWQQNYLCSIPDDAPLEYLSLVSASLAWEKHSICNLHILELRNLTTNPPSVSYLMGILSNSPTLQRLVLEDIAPHSADDATQTEFTTQDIPATSLREMKTSNIPTCMLLALVSRLAAQCHRIQLDDVPVALFEGGINSPLFSLSCCAIREVKQVSIQLTGSLNNIVFQSLPDTTLPSGKPGAPPYSFNFSLTTNDPSSDLTSITSFFSAAEPTKSKVRLDIHQVWWSADNQPLLDLTRILTNLPQLRSLRLGVGVDISRALEHLSTRYIDESSWVRWYCEDLQDLQIDALNGSNPDAISSFLEGRWRAPQWQAKSEEDTRRSKIKPWGPTERPAAKLTSLTLPTGLPARVKQVVEANRHIRLPGAYYCPI